MSEAVPFDPARLIERHQAGLWRYLRALGCEASLAEDLTQETFLIVLQKPFEAPSAAAAASYLRRVAHNLFVSHLRRSGRGTSLEQVPELAENWIRWAGHDDGEDLLEALRGCLAELSQRAKLALEMRFRHDQSRAEIAHALEMTEDGAKNLMQRAKKQLRDCIESKLK